MIKQFSNFSQKSPGIIILPVLILLLLYGPAHAATITVQPGERIQEAIDLAHNGDIIEVMSGTYRGRWISEKRSL